MLISVKSIRVRYGRPSAPATASKEKFGQPTAMTISCAEARVVVPFADDVHGKQSYRGAGGMVVLV